ncbi:chitinase [Paenibacillus shirakamiensis]|uniref:chitinase n=1 Tax=Paenibacillus shirakamiensis TaxID=1265935 RepID=A0ABS4JER5_9BACL|nr:glycosyl hydrolase family 18 protein [Paenibacillus shirakamiensis]MBP1999621.1 chitinase [Paenibacillus shirakamiensis]
MKSQFRKKSFAACLTLLLLLSSWTVANAAPAATAAGTTATPAAGAVKAAANSSYKVVGYFTDWGVYDPNYQVENIDASKLTHLNYAFADLCWNGKHGNPSNDPGNPNKTTWNCTDKGVPTQTGTVPNGAIVLGDPWSDVNNSDGVPLEWEDCEKGKCGNFYKLKVLKQANPNLKTLLSVGGWTWSNHFSDVAADSTARTNFANSAVNVIRTYGFDGIDIDWEYPVSDGLPDNSRRAADKQNFTLLLQETRNKLAAAGAQDGKSYLLTIASRANESYTQTTELSKISNILDWINIMTYDFHGDWETSTNHNAGLYSDPNDPDVNKFSADYAVNAYINAGVAPSKIVLGVPFYGRGWKGCAAGPNGDGQYQVCTPDFNGSTTPTGTWDTFETGASGMFDYGDLAANYVNKNGFVRYWNATAQVPYLYNPTSKIFISYEDPQSLAAKTSYIKSKGLGGAMIWELSEDCRTSPKFTCTGTKLLTQLGTDLNVNSTTPPVTDTTAPSVPANLTSTAKTSTSVTLKWDASTDNVGVTGYDVYQGSTLLTRVTGTTYTATGLTAQTAYTFTVKAADAAGNISAASSSLAVTTSAPATTDTQAPTAPTNPVVSAITDKGATLTWTASTDNVGVTGYQIFQGTTSVATTTGTTFNLTGLTANTSYTYTIKAKDAAGNVSAASSAVTFKTLAAASTDTQAPTTPTAVTASSKTDTSVVLKWTASTDNVGVTGYDIYKGTTLAGSVSGTTLTYTATGLTASTAYSFTVKAKDAAGNVSAASTALSVTTNAATPTTTPAWAPNTAYAVGAEVTYNGAVYVCRTAHTSLTGWEPSNVPALWTKK